MLPHGTARGIVRCMTAAHGYSGTPLPRKLGITESSRVLLLGAPAGFDLGAAHHVRPGRPGYDVQLLFCPDLATMRRRSGRRGGAQHRARCHLGGLAQEGLRSAHRPDRAPHPRARAAAGLGRHQGLRRGRGLVGPQAGAPAGTSAGGSAGGATGRRNGIGQSGSIIVDRTGRPLTGVRTGSSAGVQDRADDEHAQQHHHRVADEHRGEEPLRRQAHVLRGEVVVHARRPDQRVDGHPGQQQPPAREREHRQRHQPQRVLRAPHLVDQQERRDHEERERGEPGRGAARATPARRCRRSRARTAPRVTVFSTAGCCGRRRAGRRSPASR